MAPSYECAASILLCAEDNTTILGFDDDVEEQDGNGNGNGHLGSWILGKRSGFCGGFLMDLPLQSEDCIGLLVEREEHHLPMEGYTKRLQGEGGLDLVTIRRDAIDWICKVHAHYNFGPLTVALAANYLDRFLSVYELPQGKAWMTQLLAVACLSLAAKMEETLVPLPLDLQVGEAKYVFEARTIQRMELLVLNTLNWRMQAVTPFSFIDYFLHKFNDGDALSMCTLSESVDLILSTIRGADFIAFRPSEIAASVALSVLGEFQALEIKKAATNCMHVKKESVLRCCEVIQDKMMMGNMAPKTAGSSVFSVPQSPIGVLDAACLSHRSDDVAVGSHATSCQSSPASKRRRISR